MPYIVKVGTPWGENLGARDKYATERRSACATYSEARDEAAHEIEVITGGDPDYEEMYTDAQNFCELGETFGPLPDRSMVEVRPIEWDTLALEAGLTYPAVVAGYAQREPEGNSARQIIDAYNELNARA